MTSSRDSLLLLLIVYSLWLSAAVKNCSVTFSGPFSVSDAQNAVTEWSEATGCDLDPASCSLTVCLSGDFQWTSALRLSAGQVTVIGHTAGDPPLLRGSGNDSLLVIEASTRAAIINVSFLNGSSAVGGGCLRVAAKGKTTGGEEVETFLEVEMSSVAFSDCSVVSPPAVGEAETSTTAMGGGALILNAVNVSLSEVFGSSCSAASTAGDDAQSFGGVVAAAITPSFSLFSVLPPFFYSFENVTFSNSSADGGGCLAVVFSPSPLDPELHFSIASSRFRGCSGGGALFKATGEGVGNSITASIQSSVFERGVAAAFPGGGIGFLFESAKGGNALSIEISSDSSFVDNTVANGTGEGSVGGCVGLVFTGEDSGNNATLLLGSILSKQGGVSGPSFSGCTAKVVQADGRYAIGGGVGIRALANNSLNRFSLVAHGATFKECGALVGGIGGAIGFLVNGHASGNEFSGVLLRVAVEVCYAIGNALAVGGGVAVVAAGENSVNSLAVTISESSFVYCTSISSGAEPLLLLPSSSGGALFIGALGSESLNDGSIVVGPNASFRDCFAETTQITDSVAFGGAVSVMSMGDRSFNCFRGALVDDTSFDRCFVGVKGRGGAFFMGAGQGRSNDCYECGNNCSFITKGVVGFFNSSIPSGPVVGDIAYSSGVQLSFMGIASGKALSVSLGSGLVAERLYCSSCIGGLIRVFFSGFNGTGDDASLFSSEPRLSSLTSLAGAFVAIGCSGGSDICSHHRVSITGGSFEGLIGATGASVVQFVYEQVAGGPAVGSSLDVVFQNSSVWNFDGSVVLIVYTGQQNPGNDVRASLQDMQVHNGSVQNDVGGGVLGVVYYSKDPGTYLNVYLTNITASFIFANGGGGSIFFLQYYFPREPSFELIQDLSTSPMIVIDSCKLSHLTHSDLYAKAGGAITVIGMTSGQLLVDRVIIERSTMDSSDGGAALLFESINGAVVGVRVQRSTIAFCTVVCECSGGAAVRVVGGALFLSDTVFRSNVMVSSVPASNDVTVIGAGEGEAVFMDNCSFLDSTAAAFAVDKKEVAAQGVTWRSLLFMDVSYLAAQPFTPTSGQILLTEKHEFIEPCLPPFAPSLAVLDRNTALRCPAGSSFTSLASGQQNDVSNTQIVSKKRLNYRCDFVQSFPGVLLEPSFSSTQYATSCIELIYSLSVGCALCPTGTFSALSTNVYQPDAHCVPCPDTVSCPEGAAMFARRGMWLSPFLNDSLFAAEQLTTNDSATLLARAVTLCPQDYCQERFDEVQVYSEGRAMGMSTQCSTGRTGVLCGECLPSFSSALLSHHCIHSSVCKETAVRLPLLIFFLVIISLVYVFYLLRRSYKSSASGVFKIVTYYFSALGIVYNPSVEVEEGLSWTAALEKSAVALFSGDLGQWNSRSAEGGEPVFFICLLPSTSPIGHKTATLLVPSVLVFCIVFVGVVLGAVHKVKGRLFPVEAAIAAFYSVLMLTYSSVSSTVFALLTCSEVLGPDGTFQKVTTRAGSFGCWTNTGAGAVAGVVALTILLTVPLVVLLWHAIARGSLRARRVTCRSSRGNTTSAEERGKETEDASRRRLQTAVPLRSRPSESDEDDRPTEATDVHHTRSQRLTRRPLRRTQAGVGWIVLYALEGSYTVWWWDTVLLGRRLVLAMIGALVADAFYRSLLLFVACVAALLLHAVFMPFRSKTFHVLETLSLSSLVVIAGLSSYGAFLESLLLTSRMTSVTQVSAIPSLTAVNGAQLSLVAVAVFLIGIWALVRSVQALRSFLRQVIRPAWKKRQSWSNEREQSRSRWRCKRGNCLPKRGEGKASIANELSPRTPSIHSEQLKNRLLEG